MKYIILRTSLFFSLLFTAQQVLSKSEVQKVIDENDLVVVNAEASNIPVRYKKIVNAFGTILMEEKDENGAVEDSYFGCTGTHMGGGYVITAGHCVGANATLTSQTGCAFIEKNPLTLSNVELSEIQFGYRDQLAPFMKSKCQEIIAAQKNDDEGIDFAIIRVSPYPEEFILPDTTRHAIYGDTITIFSHPLGESLQWSKSCGNERVLNPDIPSQFIHHQCDTKPSSSGAAILNVLSLKIVGIHDGGLNDLDPATGLPLKTGMNYGTYILKSPLYEALKKLGF